MVGISRRSLTALFEALLSIGFADYRPGGRDRDLHPTQWGIINLLGEQPGLNNSEICEELDLNRGTGQYHLQVLEDEGRIYSISSGRETHYFLTTVPREKAGKLAVLRAGRAREILDAVEGDPGLMQKDLLDEVEMTRKVLRTHVDRLTEEKVVNETAVGRKRHYFLTKTYMELLSLIGNPSDGDAVDDDRADDDPADGED